MSRALKKHALIAYSLPAIPLAFAGIPLYIHAPDYFATEFGVSMGLLGAVLMSLRFIDAVQDPVIGRFSDTFSAARLKTMVIAAIVLVISFVALFQPIKEGIVFWFAGFMLLATTAFSVLSINLNTVGGLWSKDKDQKTRITSYREGLSLIGLLFAVILPSVLQQVVAAKVAFLIVGVILAVLMIVSILAFKSWQTKHQAVIKIESDEVRGSVWQVLTTLTRRTKYFFTVYLISMLASSIPAVLVLFFIRDRLALENYTGLFLCFYFLAGAAGMPFWSYISRRTSKYNAWVLSMLLAVVVFIWAATLGSGDLWQYAVICIFSGIAFGADLALPPSILADHIHSEQKELDASLHFSLLAFIAKLVLAVGSVIAFSLLDWVGFQPGQENAPSALMTLSLTYAALPCLIKVVAVGLVFYIRKMKVEGSQ